MFALILSRVCVWGEKTHTFILECLILVRLFLFLCLTGAVGLSAEEKGDFIFLTSTYPGISVRGGKVKEMLIKYPGVHSADICTSLLYGLSLALPKCTTIQRADFLSNRAAFIFPPHYPLPLEEK